MGYGSRGLRARWDSRSLRGLTAGSHLCHGVLALALVLGSVLSPLPFVSSSGTATAGEGIPVELVERRTRSSKTFRNPGGTFTTRVHAGAIHYRAQDGSWREIDSSLVPSKRAGFEFENKANAFKAHFKSQLGADHLRFEVGEAAVAMTLEGVRASAGRARGRELSYPAAFPGVELE